MRPARPGASTFIHALQPVAQSPNAIDAMTEIRDVCNGTGELSAGTREWLARCTSDWLSAGGGITLDEAFGQKAKRGHRYTVAHAHARRERALFTAIPDLRGSTAWAKAGDLERVLSGEATAPSRRVREELDKLKAEGCELPRSRRQLFAAIADLLKRNPDLTTDRDL
jgi:hypothetical protein